MAQLLSNLPIGAKVKFGKYSVEGETAEPITWLVVAKNHDSLPAYSANTVTLLTEKVIDYRAFDANEPSNTDSTRATSGNNRYSLSNIDQWLNKDNAGGKWYSPQHSVDQAPDDAHVTIGAPYTTRPGFLNAFTLLEKNAILSTTLRVAIPPQDGGGYEDIVRKVFLASVTEVGLENQHNTAEGAKWDYFNSANRIVNSTEQVYRYSKINSKPSSVSESLYWWLRTPHNDPHTACGVTPKGEIAGLAARVSTNGVRPVINLSAFHSVSDTTDSDGCYTVAPNSAPTSPTIVAAPTTVYGGKSNSISWSVATDPEGGSLTYQLECSIDGGEYTEIYSGAAITYAHLVPFGATSVTYRVKAIDPLGESSAYTVSGTKSVVNNYAPIIVDDDGTQADKNLGVKSSGFTGTYTVTDANSDIVTVTEAIDGVQIRSLVATLGQEITYGVTENTWLALPNGSHTLTISATDGIDTTVRTYVFTKLVETLKIMNTAPWEASTMPSRIMLVVTRNIPSASTFKVEVCNNGYDSSPTWEDATDAVVSGLAHVFSNAKKTASLWGVRVRVTVARNGATGVCYISAIGGNFE